MRNPGWTPARSRSPRLADVAEQLLGSSRAPRRPAPRPVATIPILIVLPDGELADGRTLVGRLDAELAASAGVDTPVCRLRALPSRATLPAGGQALIVLGRTSLEGIRQIYGRLKQIPREPAPRIGVLLTGEADPETVTRCHERLALAAFQFLGLPVLALGHLPVQGVERGPDVAQAAGRVRRLLRHL